VSRVIQRQAALAEVESARFSVELATRMEPGELRTECLDEAHERLAVAYDAAARFYRPGSPSCVAMRDVADLLMAGDAR